MAYTIDKIHLTKIRTISDIYYNTIFSKLQVYEFQCVDNSNQFHCKYLINCGNNAVTLMSEFPC